MPIVEGRCDCIQVLRPLVPRSLPTWWRLHRNAEAEAEFRKVVELDREARTPTITWESFTYRT